MITRVRYPQRRHVAHLLGGVLMWHRPKGVSRITQHAVPPGREEPLGRGPHCGFVDSPKLADCLEKLQRAGRGGGGRGDLG